MRSKGLVKERSRGRSGQMWAWGQGGTQCWPAGRQLIKVRGLGGGLHPCVPELGSGCRVLSCWYKRVLKQQCMPPCPGPHPAFLAWAVLRREAEFPFCTQAWPLQGKLATQS